MDNVSPDEILQQASAAASAMLPGLEDRRESLSKQLNDLDIQISRLRSIAQIVDKQHTNEATNIPSQGLIFTAHSGDKPSKAPRGQADAQISEVLRHAGPRTAKEIKDMLEVTFGIDYNRSSIHQTLQRGLKAGKYKCEASKWSLVK